MRLGVAIGGLLVLLLVVVTLVDGNHGGAKAPPAKRWSKKIFRVVVLPDLACMAIRPPTRFRLLMCAPTLIHPPELVVEIIAMEASIHRFPSDCWLSIWMSPMAVKIPRTCPV